MCPSLTQSQVVAENVRLIATAGVITSVRATSVFLDPIHASPLPVGPTQSATPTGWAILFAPAFLAFRPSRIQSLAVPGLRPAHRLLIHAHLAHVAGTHDVTSTTSATLCASACLAMSPCRTPSLVALRSPTHAILIPVGLELNAHHVVVKQNVDAPQASRATRMCSASVETASMTMSVLPILPALTSTAGTLALAPAARMPTARCVTTDPFAPVPRVSRVTPCAPVSGGLWLAAGRPRRRALSRATQSSLGSSTRRPGSPPRPPQGLSLDRDTALP